MIKNTVSISQAAEILNVSTATVRNWLKSKLLDEENNSILRSSLDDLIKELASGDITKLRSRANKNNSVNKFIPEELNTDNLSIEELRGIIFTLTEIDCDPRDLIKDYLSFLKNERSDRYEILKKIPGIEKIRPDILYQSLRQERSLSKTGAYFTPDPIIRDTILDLDLTCDMKIYDPCSGTGAFLKFIDENYNSLELYGTDIDDTALEISKYIMSNPLNDHHLRKADSLFLKEPEEYDIIITNPPWGAHFSSNRKKELNRFYDFAGSGDSLEYFLLKGFRSLKTGGIMTYILPESFMYVKRFEKIRTFLLSNTSIEKIKTFGRKFSKVFSKTVRIRFKKVKPVLEHKIAIELSENTQYKITQSDFLDEFDHIYNIESTYPDKILLKKIFEQSHITLKNNSLWNLGIVTGNNNKFISQNRTDKYSLSVITGKDIEKYTLKQSEKFLYDDFSEFHQVPKDQLYYKEKLVYKFISDKLVFAYDDSGKYSLNSANVLIPKLPGYPIKVVMAILNSELMDFIYRKKFNSIKVLRSNLERLPFPAEPDENIIIKVENIVNKLLNLEPTLNETLTKKLDELIYSLYKIDPLRYE